MTGSIKGSGLGRDIYVWNRQSALVFCTDGGLSLSGSYGGLQALIRNKAPDSVLNNYKLIHKIHKLFFNKLITSFFNNMFKRLKSYFPNFTGQLVAILLAVYQNQNIYYLIICQEGV